MDQNTKTEDFDAYRKWLGIHPEERPVNHYRLLGIASFEADRDVIGSAADRQLAHVRSFQTGEHSAICQKILNDIARARTILLDPTKKAKYNEELRETIAAQLASPSISRSGYTPSQKVARTRAAKNSHKHFALTTASATVLLCLYLAFLYRAPAPRDSILRDPERPPRTCERVETPETNPRAPSAAGSYANPGFSNPANTMPSSRFDDSSAKPQLTVEIPKRTQAVATAVSESRTVSSQVAENDTGDAGAHAPPSVQQVAESTQTDVLTKQNVGPQDDLPILAKVVTADRTVIVGGLQYRNETHVEIIDLKTGMPRMFRIADLHSFQENVSDSSAIASVGLPPFLAWKIKQNTPQSGTGRIAKIDGPSVYVSLGSETGIEVGRQLTALRGGAEIKDPVTGEILGKARESLAQLRIVQVIGDRLSLTTLVGEPKAELAVGDVVETTMPTNAVAVLPLTGTQGDFTEEGNRFVLGLTNELVILGVPIVDRNHLDAVLKELHLQHTDDFDAKHAQKIGKQIGAAAILTGTLVVGRSGWATAQLRLIRVDTGAIVCGVSQRLGRLHPEPRAVNRGRLQGRIVNHYFRDEDEISRNWTIGGKWRIENGTLGLFPTGKATSKNRYIGDFAMELAYSIGESAGCTLTVWGETFHFGLMNPEFNVVRLTRQGDTLVWVNSRVPEKQKVVKLKKQQLDAASPVVIALSWPGPDRDTVRVNIERITIRGTVANDPLDR